MTERLPCRYGSPALRWPGRHGQRGRAAPGLGAENHQGRLGLLCQVRGRSGGLRAWDAPGGGRTWNPDGLTCPGPCAAWNATCARRGSGRRSSLARPREVEAIVKELPQGGSHGPELGSAAFLGPGSSGGHLAAPRRALCCSGGGAARCHGGQQAFTPSSKKKSGKKKASAQLPPCGSGAGT